MITDRTNLGRIRHCVPNGEAFRDRLLLRFEQSPKDLRPDDMIVIDFSDERELTLHVRSSQEGKVEVDADVSLHGRWIFDLTKVDDLSWTVCLQPQHNELLAVMPAPMRH